jgi:hypothetical protein
LAWLGKLWKIVFGYIDNRAPRMADRENAIPQTYCKNTRSIALGYAINIFFLMAEVRILESGHIDLRRSSWKKVSIASP